MDSFSYPKPVRFPLGPRIEGKPYLREAELKKLLSSRLVVEEKMDGRQTIIEIGNYVLCMEDLKRTHSIKYRVPGRYALFDVFEMSSQTFLDRDAKLQFWEDLVRGRIEHSLKMLIFPVACVSRPNALTLEQVPSLVRTSAYAIGDGGAPALMEGVVVKVDGKLPPAERLAGKFVRQEFTDGITVSYLDRPITYNIIDPSVPVKLTYEGGD
ncbi:MAG: RNA ligase family protein [Candidatus Micrarchaeia archaeon]